MPFDPVDPIIALCTFTPDAEAAVPLGTDDCWVEVAREPGLIRYTVHSQYIGRAGVFNRITGAERALVENYFANLYDLIHVGSVPQMGTIAGIPLFIPRSGHIPGTLVNPFTSLNVSGLYARSLDFTDTGGRQVDFEMQFVKPLPPAGTTIGTADFTWGGNEIGNQPGRWEESVDQNFLRITVQTYYSGANPETYVSTLAAALGLDTIYPTAYVRGAPGNRGVIKSYNQAADDLVWVSRGETVLAMYPESVQGRLSDDDVVELSVTFVKNR
jgi:hypothetical protein